MSEPSSRASTAPRERRVAIDDLFAARVATALRGELVFDHQTRKTRLRVAFDAALDVERVAVSGVGVADHGNRDRGTDVATLVEHFRVADKPGIGSREPRRRDRKPAHEGQWKTRPLDQTRGKGVEAARHRDDAGFCEQRAQPIGRRGRHLEVRPRNGVARRR
jgi:hypothetical protein